MTYYICWNCGEKVTYGKPHACDTEPKGGKK